MMRVSFKSLDTARCTLVLSGIGYVHVMSRIVGKCNNILISILQTRWQNWYHYIGKDKLKNLYACKTYWRWSFHIVFDWTQVSRFSILFSNFTFFNFRIYFEAFSKYIFETCPNLICHNKPLFSEIFLLLETRDRSALFVSETSPNVLSTFSQFKISCVWSPGNLLVF